MTFCRLFSILFIVGAVLFCTVRLPAQTTGGTAQVSPVANLQGSNASVVNNNFQYLQNDTNAVLYILSQYFTGGILNTNSGGLGFNASNGVTGDTLVLTGTGQFGFSANIHGIQQFTANGTFTPITGDTLVYLTGCAGGGGGGANKGSANVAGGGGASGQQIVDLPFTVTPGTGYTVTIGTGGAGGNGSGGSQGNSTSFGTITLLGGVGGSQGSGTTGAGGPILAGTYGFGNPGGSGSASTGGSGAGSIVGTGAIPTTDTTPSNAPNNSCGGGASATVDNAGNYAGSNGGSGFMKVQW